MMNPLLDEQIRAGFINFVMIRLHLAGLAVITFLVFLFYPSQPISYFLARSVKPEMFNIALYTILAFTTYLTIKAAVFNIQDTKIINLKDWFLYTKISTMTYLWGRLAYGLFYSTFLILLFLPVLLVSGSVSGLNPLNLTGVILLLYIYTLTLYLLGMFFFILFKRQHWILTLMLWFILLVTIFISPTFFPASHPFLLLVGLQKADNIFNALKGPLAAAGLFSSALILFSGALIHFYRRSVHD